MSAHEKPEKHSYPAYESLRRGAREAAVENEAIGGMDQFRKPGEHVPPVNRQPSPPPTLTVEEYLKKYELEFHGEAWPVLLAAVDLTGNWERARAWIRSEPLAALGGKTAPALVAEGRADDVLRLIESLQAGAAG